MPASGLSFFFILGTDDTFILQALAAGHLMKRLGVHDTLALPVAIAEVHAPRNDWNYVPTRRASVALAELDANQKTLIDPLLVPR